MPLKTHTLPERPEWEDEFQRLAGLSWTRGDGGPLDPWLRAHWRLGAEVLRVAPRTLVIEGSVAEWEAWTEMLFPDSGPYVVPGALQPVIIDRERDRGRYEDPNVWMLHPITGAPAWT